ncbi:MAG: hypothetical protein LLF94_09020 [Chlamydiales bacterium]|nr:hypothetical protein [Chlamydiales bacterium]
MTVLSNHFSMLCEIFPDETIRHAFFGKFTEKHSLFSISLKDNFKKIPSEKQATLASTFLACIEKQNHTAQEHVAGFLLEKVVAEIKKIEDLKPLCKKICALFELAKSDKATRDNPFPEDLGLICEYNKVAANPFYAYRVEAKLHAAAKNDKDMKQRKEAFTEKTKTTFGYSTIPSFDPNDSSQKICTSGTVRSDKDNCCEDYWSMVLKEDIGVIVQLNTLSDWNKAVDYCSEEELAKLTPKLKCTFVCEKVETLYEGTFATNIEKSARKAHADTPLDSEVLTPYRARIEERSIRIIEGKNERVITQLRFVNWQDHYHAKDLKAFDVLMKRQEALRRFLHKPIAVHCQGGVGRTGEFVHVLAAMREIDNIPVQDLPNAHLNLSNLYWKLKTHAPKLGSKPSPERYAEIHQIVYNYFQSKFA